MSTAGRRSVRLSTTDLVERATRAGARPVMGAEGITRERAPLGL